LGIRWIKADGLLHKQDYFFSGPSLSLQWPRAINADTEVLSNASIVSCS